MRIILFGFHLVVGVTAMCGVGLASGPPFANSGLWIEENGGQFPAPMRFGARAGATTVGFGERVVYRNGSASVAMEFAGARGVAPVPEQVQPGRIHAYRGADQRHWRRDLRAFSAVRYAGLYPGIDLQFHTGTGAMEYDFLVAPGVNPRAIRFRFRDARRVSLNYEGDLLVELSNGEVLRHQRPVAYQAFGEERRAVAAFFRLRGEEVSFHVARYDRSKALVIDPVLRFATVMQAPLTQIATDAASNSYVVSGFAFAGVIDKDFICWKFDAQGKLIYKVYLGGVGWEVPSEAVADGSGNLFVTGTSNSADYPVNTSPCRGPNNDVFLTKLGVTGAILASRCFGGVRAESVAGMGLDSSGFVHVGGTTESNDLPTTAGAFQTQPRLPDAKSGFVTKFDGTTLAVATSTLVGGFGVTEVHHMVVEPNGAALLVGAAWQSGFRVTPGAYLTTGPSSQVNYLHFLTRVAPGAASLSYSTFVPGNYSSVIRLRAGVDGASQAVVAIDDGLESVRLYKFNSSGSQLLFNKLAPGRSGAASMEVDAAGNILLVVADTNSYALSADTLQMRSANMVVVKYDPSASNVLFASAMTGAGALAKFGPGNEILVAARLTSSALPQRFPITPGASSETPNAALPLGNEFFGLYRIAAGSAACNPALEVSHLPLPDAGQTLTLGVSAPANCTWAASILQHPGGWVTLEGPSYGTGNGGFMISAKALTAPETGRLAVVSVSPSASVTLTQGAPPGCTPITAGSLGTDGAAAIREIHFSLPDACPWTVTSDASWLRIASASSGMGSAVIHAALDANTGTTARTGNVRINGQAVEVHQNICMYNFGGALLDSRASVQPMTVAAEVGCPWTITSNANWVRLNIDSTTVRSGPLNVLAEIDENLTNAARTATFTMAGRTFLLQQTANTCFPSATATQSVFPSGGGNASFTVVVPAACTAQGSIATPAALVSTSTPQAGTSAFAFNVAANTSPLPRAFRAMGGVLGLHVFLPLLQEGLNPTAPFEDVPVGHPFFSHIAILKDRQVTRGCTFDGKRFCPSEIVTRAEMASFLARALKLSGAGGVQHFEDVPPTHPHFAAIQAIRTAGITFGCATLPDRYCPDQPLTRGQMAALMIRAIAGDNVAYSFTASFTDVNINYGFFRHVQRMKELGVTLGCTATTYCPDSLTTRGEMAAFLVRAFCSK
ncbi:MAG: S-layer homology domain-containing protein [Bryobacterales bacterium]|nr:S-layer homology domain-containing protein [Bryobacterales bacterium]